MKGARPERAAARQSQAFAPTDWWLLGVAAVIFGSSLLFMAEALESFTPAVVTFLRIIFGLVVLSLFPSSWNRIERNDWGRVAVLGVAWFAAPLTLFPLAQQHIDSSLAGMLHGATPIASALVAAGFIGRLPSRRQATGLAAGFAGIALITIPSFNAGPSAATGIALGIGAVACYGLAFNLAAPLQRRYGSLPVLRRALLVAAVLTAAPAAAGTADSVFALSALAACLAVGILGTGVAYVATATLTGRVGSTRASLLTYVATPVSIALGIVIRSEAFLWLTGIGTALTLFGAFVASLPDRPSASAVPCQE